MATCVSAGSLLRSRLGRTCRDGSAAHTRFRNPPLHRFGRGTHAEEIADTRLTPDAARNGLEVSDVIKVSGLQFARTAPGWVRDWHVAERHQYIVTLSGRGEIELAGGRKIPLEPGSVILAEDSTGKGHISRTLGTEDRIDLNIQLADR